MLLFKMARCWTGCIGLYFGVFRCGFGWYLLLFAILVRFDGTVFGGILTLDGGVLGYDHVADFLGGYWLFARHSPYFLYRTSSSSSTAVSRDRPLPCLA